MKQQAVAFDLTRFGGTRPLGSDESDARTGGNRTGMTSVPSVPRDRGTVYSRGEEGGSDPTERVSKTVDIARDTRDSRGQAASDPQVGLFRFAGSAMQFGDVCLGWEPARWASELRRKADRCALYRPDIADYYRRWASDIEAKLGEKA